MSIHEEKQPDLEEEVQETASQEDQEAGSLGQEEPEDKELEKVKDQFLRLQADYSNYKRRTENERQEYYKLGVEKLALGLLEVLDNFDRALETGEDKEDAFYEGMSLISKQLYGILEKNNIVEIEAINQDFDPNHHHAVLVEEVEGVEEGKVVEVLQKGYLYGDKVIRPAMVKVSQ
ncbi:MAG: nucleotide exchange factor GrpE [Tissierellia bacterium]|nr:nucleotide exchange factor GrpE [Tissierellia bacterium]